MKLSSVFAVMFLGNSNLVDRDGYQYSATLENLKDVGFSDRAEAEAVKRELAESYPLDKLAVVEIKAQMNFV